jgi:hypothetical protein
MNTTLFDPPSYTHWYQYYTSHLDAYICGASCCAGLTLQYATVGAVVFKDAKVVVDDSVPAPSEPSSIYPGHIQILIQLWRDQLRRYRCDVLDGGSLLAKRMSSCHTVAMYLHDYCRVLCCSVPRGWKVSWRQCCNVDLSSTFLCPSFRNDDVILSFSQSPSWSPQSKSRVSFPPTSPYYRCPTDTGHLSYIRGWPPYMYI